jgi:hypothetical protein
MTASDEGLAATLFQLSEHGERIAGLDTREADHFREIGGRLTDLGTRVTGMAGTISDQGEILSGLEGLDEDVAALTARLDEIAPEEDDDEAIYRPIPSPRWWVLRGEPRQEARARLHAWVEQIYRPGYGVLATQLGQCWELHPLCLYSLDWLSELWSCLYLRATRNPSVLAGQAEWQTRLLPALAEQMAIETSRCGHDRSQRANGTANGTLAGNRS